MVKREMYLQRIRPFYESEMVKVLSGIRRCGKSTLLKQIIEEIKGGGVDEERIVYINFEDYQYRRLSNSDALYEYILDRTNKEERFYLFVDEIQNVDEFELVINSFRTTHNMSIFITGSNSKLLSGELSTHLSGRTVSFKVLPFNFKEYVEFKGIKGSMKTIDELFEEFMEWGGFPLVCNEEDIETKHVIMSNIYNSVVLKDVIVRNGISSPSSLERVLEYLIAGTSTSVSGNKIAAELEKTKFKISAPMVYDFIGYITGACICDKVSRYDIRGKRVLAKEEKMYVCDLGLFKLNKNPVKDEYNYIIETIVYNELVARGYKVYVGKTYKGEIDFIAEKGDEKIYIQATYLLSNEKVIEREFGAFNNVKDFYPKYVISMDKHLIKGNGIMHLNLIEWLMGE